MSTDLQKTSSIERALFVAALPVALRKELSDENLDQLQELVGQFPEKSVLNLVKELQESQRLVLSHFATDLLVQRVLDGDDIGNIQPEGDIRYKRLKAVHDGLRKDLETEREKQLETGRPEGEKTRRAENAKIDQLNTDLDLLKDARAKELAAIRPQLIQNEIDLLTGKMEALEKGEFGALAKFAGEAEKLKTKKAEAVNNEADLESAIARKYDELDRKKLKEISAAEEGLEEAVRSAAIEAGKSHDRAILLLELKGFQVQAKQLRNREGQLSALLGPIERGVNDISKRIERAAQNVLDTERKETGRQLQDLHGAFLTAVGKLDSDISSARKIAGRAVIKGQKNADELLKKVAKLEYNLADLTTGYNKEKSKIEAELIGVERLLAKKAEERVELETKALKAAEKNIRSIYGPKIGAAKSKYERFYKGEEARLKASLKDRKIKRELSSFQEIFSRGLDVEKSAPGPVIEVPASSIVPKKTERIEPVGTEAANDTGETVERLVPASGKRQVNKLVAWGSGAAFAVVSGCVLAYGAMKNNSGNADVAFASMALTDGALTPGQKAELAAQGKLDQLIETKYMSSLESVGRFVPIPEFGDASLTLQNKIIAKAKQTIAQSPFNKFKPDAENFYLSYIKGETTLIMPEALSPRDYTEFANMVALVSNTNLGSKVKEARAISIERDNTVNLAQQAIIDSLAYNGASLVEVDDSNPGSFFIIFEGGKPQRFSRAVAKNANINTAAEMQSLIETKLLKKKTSE